MRNHDGEDQRKAATVDAVDPRLGDLKTPRKHPKPRRPNSASHAMAIRRCHGLHALHAMHALHATFTGLTSCLASGGIAMAFASACRCDGCIAICRCSYPALSSHIFQFVGLQNSCGPSDSCADIRNIFQQGSLLSMMPRHVDFLHHLAHVDGLCLICIGNHPLPSCNHLTKMQNLKPSHRRLVAGGRFR